MYVDIDTLIDTSVFAFCIRIVLMKQHDSKTDSVVTRHHSLCCTTLLSTQTAKLNLFLGISIKTQSASSVLSHKLTTV